MEFDWRIFVIIAFLLYPVLSNASEKLELKAVAIVHRHGDRTPLNTFPTDPYKDISFWPDGWGELTSAGKKRMYKLGQYLANRYKNFFPLNIREIWIRSSNIDRTLESAQLVLAGAFPPKDRWIWNPTLNWVPFPIYSQDKDDDGMLNSKSRCPAAEKELDNIHSSAKYLSISKNYKDLMAYLTDKTGSNISDLVSAHRIHDTLKIQQENNLNLPEWATSDVMRRLSEISDLTFTLDFSTRLIQRLRGGLLLKDLKEKFTHYPSPVDSNSLSSVQPKVFFYSTHDTQIALLLSCLNVFNEISPPYAATVLFELYELTDKTLVVSALYHNSSEHEPFPLNIPGCGFKYCDLRIFSNYIDDLIPNDWDVECERNKIPKPLELVYTAILITFCIIIVTVALMIASSCFLKKEKASLHLYRRIPVF